MAGEAFQAEVAVAAEVADGRFALPAYKVAVILQLQKKPPSAMLGGFFITA